MIHDRWQDWGVVREDTTPLIVIPPGVRVKFVIEFRKGRPTKVLEVSYIQKVLGYTKWGWGFETL